MTSSSGKTKVTRLIAGTMTAPAAVWRAGDDVEQPVCFPVPSYLIERGSERILVDTGLHPGTTTEPSRSGCFSSSRRRASPTRSMSPDSPWSCSPTCTSTTPAASS